jgi:hypothetical protein
MGKLSAKITDSGAKVSKALDAFASTAKRATMAAPVIASKVLAQASYAPPGVLAQAKSMAPQPKAHPDPAVNAFRDREQELRAQTALGPDGQPRITMPAARDLHERVAGIWAVNPKLADNIEAGAIKRVEFLASKLPERPPFEGMRVGPDSWAPADLDLRKFARYVDAAEGGPARVLERMNHGTMTPEDAETLRECYPDTYADIQQQLIEKLAGHPDALPYQKRLMLGILFDVATDPALQPHMIASLQGRFAQEQGTQGGSQAPQPKSSQMKALTAPDATAAQKLST